jgi:hypothetical protein
MSNKTAHAAALKQFNHDSKIAHKRALTKIIRTGVVVGAVLYAVNRFVEAHADETDDTK